MRRLPLRTVLIMLIVMLIMYGVSIAVASGVEIYLHTRTFKHAVNPKTVFGVNRHAAYIVIESIDLNTHTMTIQAYSRAVDADLRMRVGFGDDLIVEKQDAVMDNGVFVGVTKRSPATLRDVASSTRALAVIAQINEVSFMEYLLIGDPFPLP